MEIVEVTEERREDFDAFVGSHLWGDVLQGWAWGEAQSAVGWQTHHLLLKERGEPIGALSVLRRELPIFGEILYAPRGPVLDPGKHGLWRALAHHLRRRFPHAFLFSCEPRIDEEQRRPPGYWRGRRKVPFQRTQPRIIAEIPLSGDPGLDLSRLHATCRKNLRRASRQGVRTREGGPEDTIAFARMLQATARRKGFQASPEFLERVLAAFSKAGQGAIFLAGRDAEDLAGVFCARIGRHAVSLYGASDDAAGQDMANYDCLWSAISWAAAGGAERFDLSAMAKADRPGQPLSGLRRFKMQWGAIERRYLGALDVPLRLPTYFAYRALEPILSRFPRMRARPIPAPSN